MDKQMPAGQVGAVEQAIGKILCPEVLARAHSGVWDMKGGTKLRRAAEAAIAASGAEHISRAVSAQAETIASWLPKDGKFAELTIDSDMVEAWVKRLREIAGGAPDETALDRVNQEHIKEHIAGLVSYLERFISEGTYVVETRPDDPHYFIIIPKAMHEKAKQALEALPPELRGK